VISTPTTEQGPSSPSPTGIQPSRCTLCPAGCELRITRTGPDVWQCEFPTASGAGLCPRGATLGQLLGHRERIITAAQRNGEALGEMALADALAEVARAVESRSVALVVSPNIPCDQMVAIAAACSVWPAAKLAFAIEPAERQLLLGLEAGNCEYLDEEALGACDGFLIIGDAFAANPRCARAVFDQRGKIHGLPIVVIDAAAGTAAKFATHRAPAAPGTELDVLAAIANAAGAKLDAPCNLSDAARAGAEAAGQAIGRCARLGIIIAAEHGRGGAWRQIGHLAARLAGALGGGVAAQTDGAGALAALRLGTTFGAVAPAAALADEGAAIIAIGCDLLGMLGWQGRQVLAAAAALPNKTTDAAQFVLPLAMPGELAGRYMFDNASRQDVAPLLPPPASVPTPAELVSALAAAAGAPESPAADGQANCLNRIDVAPPAAAGAAAPAEGPVLLLRREAAQAGCGELTGLGTWQSARTFEPKVWLAPDDARQMGIGDLDHVTVSAGGRSLTARAHLSPQQAPGAAVMSEGLPEVRALVPCTIDGAGEAIVAAPPTVTITAPDNPQET